MNEQSDSTVICAWCAAALKRGNLKSPMSHGICLTCMAKATGHSIEDLSHARPEILDALPFGAIQITGDGTITAYSRGESALSGLSPASVIGKNFFRTIAPCAAVKEFQGEIESLRAGRENGRVRLRFVFKYSSGAKMVDVAVAYHAATDSSTLLVKVVLSEPNL
jgi:photoactive yellow protein